MDETMISQHKAQLSLMESDHLLGLWNSANTEGFTPEGAEALRQVLQERLGLLPEPGVRYTPHETYFEQERLESTSLRLETLSNLFLVIAGLGAIGFLASFVAVAANIASQPGSFLDTLDITYSIASLLPFLQATFVAAALVYLLRGASQALLILMDIEANTRSKVP